MDKLETLCPVVEWEWAVVIDQDEIVIRATYLSAPLRSTAETSKSAWFQMSLQQASNLKAQLDEAFQKVASVAEARRTDRQH